MINHVNNVTMTFLKKINIHYIIKWYINNFHRILKERHYLWKKNSKIFEYKCYIVYNITIYKIIILLK